MLSRRYFIFLPLVALGLMACDRSVAPRRSLTLANRGLGDFTLPMEGVVLPDTVNPHDTIHVAFTVGSADPCSYYTTMTVWYSDVTYLANWGVRNPGNECRAMLTSFPVGSGLIDDIDPCAEMAPASTPRSLWTQRVVLCQPSGPPITKTFVLRYLILTPRVNADSVRRADQAMCARLTQAD